MALAPADTTNASPTPGLGTLTILLTLAGWVVTPLFIRHFASWIDPWTSNGWRYGFAALIWLPVLILGARRKTLPAGLWRAALVPAAINSAAQVCFTAAHYQIDPGLLTFSLRVQVVFVTIGAIILFPPERRIVASPLYILGLVLVLAGTMVTITLDSGFGSRATNAGIALALAAGALFACYGLSVRHYMQRTPSLTAFAAISQLTALVQIALMLVLARDRGTEAITLLSAQLFALLLLSAVIGIALGHVFYYISIKRLGVAVSAAVIQLQPFGVGIASYFAFGEVLGLGQWLAGMIAVVGAGMILWVQHRLTSARRLAPSPNDLTTTIDQLPAPPGRTPGSTRGP